MGHFFRYAIGFNQNLNNWNTSSVTTMDHTFYFASAFSPDLRSWNVAQVTNMDKMLNGTLLSTNNYDAILDSWSGQSVQQGVVFSVGITKYSPAQQASRDILTNNAQWVITDGGAL